MRLSLFHREAAEKPLTAPEAANLVGDFESSDAGGLSPCAPLSPAVFEKRVDRIGPRVYCASGFALSNVAMIEVNGGKIIVDATESVQAAREIKAKFDELVPGPVKAIIFTHSHPDHILGASVFADSDTDIWAHENFAEELATQMGILSRTVRRRASKQFGECLTDDRFSGAAIGPGLRLDQDAVPPILFPTHTFRDKATIITCGVRLDLEDAPGETRDHLLIHLPEERTVFAGDNLYRAFPNLHAIRGAPPRPARYWIQSLDKIRRLAPEYLVLGHTEAIQGEVTVQETLTVYRDAIAYLYAAVMRRTNEGMTPDELASSIQLPDHLRSHPYLEERYGRVAWAVRGIYEGSLGWFDGNPTNLCRLPPAEHAARLIALAGGVDKIETAIQKALQDHDPQWAAELCDSLAAAVPKHQQVKEWKAQALEALAQRDHNVLARNYYHASAGELRGTWSCPPRAPVTAETLRAVPIDNFLHSLPLRLRPDRTAELNLRIGFEFTDSGKIFTFYVRRGVGEILAGVLDSPDFIVSGDERDFKALASGRAAAARAALLGSLRCSGGLRKLSFLRSILDPP